MTTASLTPSAASHAAETVNRAIGAGLRLAAALGLAGAITFSLFMMMQALIGSDAPPAQPAGDEPLEVVIAFHPPEFDPPRGPRPNPVERIAPPPAAPVIDTDVERQPISGGFSMAPPDIESAAVMSGLERIALPPPPLDTRVEPTYPRSELARGVQGDCTVRYDILASGQTANMSIIACDSAGFERASLEAVARWRHAAARGEDPGTVVRRGVMTTLSFRLQD
jgi:TonB family protein